MAAALDLTGKRFGRLTIIGSAPKRGEKRRWVARCDCGNELICWQGTLQNGKRRSCGCIRIIHGKARSRIYRIWQGMMQRCTNPAKASWPDYGGRGITVAPEWLSFERFYADMGDPPTDDHTLDRRNNNLDYSKENCRWATHAEQAANTRRNRLIEYQGQLKCIAEWAREYGIGRERLRQRIMAGWSMELALSLPRNKRHQTAR